MNGDYLVFEDDARAKRILEELTERYCPLQAIYRPGKSKETYARMQCALVIEDIKKEIENEKERVNHGGTITPTRFSAPRAEYPESGK